MAIEQITHEVNGVKYLIFEYELNSRTHEKFTRKTEEYNGITQSVKKTSGFWSETTVTVKVLIPEIHAVDFCNSFT
ncbi:hypothetical protein SAMN05443549_107160 [Flavobacterium fluvii]|uniref:Uncharacterized protein n=1 Tax=Flavobacterium fluvii TaxID=468056 RepID=A0A1M5N9H7_9FLAO|nr:hypothetical protein [Flavobacterium fluvii]SHG86161.1 hypothetical protein SAMN05443549_107160 [Flavobacterium fluvii]